MDTHLVLSLQSQVTKSSSLFKPSLVKPNILYDEMFIKGKSNVSVAYLRHTEAQIRRVTNMSP